MDWLAQAKPISFYVNLIEKYGSPTANLSAMNLQFISCFREAMQNCSYCINLATNSDLHQTEHKKNNTTILRKRLNLVP